MTTVLGSLKSNNHADNMHFVPHSCQSGTVPVLKSVVEEKAQ